MADHHSYLFFQEHLTGGDSGGVAFTEITITMHHDGIFNTKTSHIFYISQLHLYYFI